ncbi:hypothetical protein D1817_00745 [Flavobacteriaceae bacterium]|nr:hypothetical protein D1817_00745 [Flavobacteriaceae bacterium]
MKTYLSNEVHCFVFGHNFYEPKNLSNSREELTCKCCNTTIIRDIDIDENELSPSSNEIKALLIRLHSLKKSRSSNRISFES